MSQTIKFQDREKRFRHTFWWNIYLNIFSCFLIWIILWLMCQRTFYAILKYLIIALIIIVWNTKWNIYPLKFIPRISINVSFDSLCNIIYLFKNLNSNFINYLGKHFLRFGLYEIIKNVSILFILGWLRLRFYGNFEYWSICPASNFMRPHSIHTSMSRNLFIVNRIKIVWTKTKFIYNPPIYGWLMTIK